MLCLCFFLAGLGFSYLHFLTGRLFFSGQLGSRISRVVRLLPSHSLIGSTCQWALHLRSGLPEQVGLEEWPRRAFGQPGGGGGLSGKGQPELRALGKAEPVLRQGWSGRQDRRRRHFSGSCHACTSWPNACPPGPRLHDRRVARCLSHWLSPSQRSGPHARCFSAITLCFGLNFVLLKS